MLRRNTLKKQIKTFLLPEETRLIREFANPIIDDLHANNLIPGSRCPKPTIYVLQATPDKGLPISGLENCGGAFWPYYNEIYLVGYNTNMDALEYKSFRKSKYIGAMQNLSKEDMIKFDLLHELAHWVDYWISKEERVNHKYEFRFIYAFLRATYLKIA